MATVVSITQLTGGAARPVTARRGRKSSARAAHAAIPKSSFLCGSISLPSGGSLAKGGLRASRAPITRAAVSQEVTATEWWKQKKELFVDIHTEEDFEREVLNAEENKLIVVEFYAPWCAACKGLYPHLVSQVEMRKDDFKWCKVCVDELKHLTKSQGVTTMPFIGFYRPGDGLLVGSSYSKAPMKLAQLKSNLSTMRDHPNAESFTIDPNGFYVASRRDREGSAGFGKAIKQEKKGMFGNFFHQTKGGSGNGSNAPAPKASPSKPTPPSIAKARKSPRKAGFLARYKGEYGYPGHIDDFDEFYDQEIGSRMGVDHYMDYTGASMYCKSQLEAVFKDLGSHVYGNPHSANPSSELTEEKVEGVRLAILRYFNADPADYTVVFTRSATGALKIVGETFPWGPSSEYRYLRESHNSVLGVREYALRGGGEFNAVSEAAIEEWLAGEGGEEGAGAGGGGGEEGAAGVPAYSLFAFPGEDNFAGVKYPLDWIDKVKARSTEGHEWKVMLDAAALVPTQPLDLSKYPADFVAMSFYKMFGYPTGVGALIVRNTSSEVLRKVFWGGGTVSLASAANDFHVLKCRPSDRFEDGTVPFLDIIALEQGLAMMKRLGGVEAVSAHVHAITTHLVTRLTAIKHGNGAPVVKVFGKHGAPDARERQGGVVNFEVLSPEGDVRSYHHFEEMAAKHGIHVRTGCECNPGACYSNMGLAEEEVEVLEGIKEGCGDEVEFVDVMRADGDTTTLHSPSVPSHPDSEGQVGAHWVSVPLGSVRASLGYMSTYEDAEALADLVEKYYVDATAEPADSE